jgi:hypothetical protein
MNNQLITAHEVPLSARAAHVGKLFQARWHQIESFAFDSASSLSEDYHGGYWDYFALSNDGFWMAPNSAVTFRVTCDNGFDGTLSANAFGVTVCLYAYSLCSFSPDETFAELCARHYHLLREFAIEHAEARAILAAID